MPIPVSLTVTTMQEEGDMGSLLLLPSSVDARGKRSSFSFLGTKVSLLLSPPLEEIEGGAAAIGSILVLIVMLPESVNLTALPTTFNSTCLSLAGSAQTGITSCRSVVWNSNPLC